MDQGILQSLDQVSEWSATDFAFIIHHTWTIPEQTKDNTISLGLRDVTLAFSWLFRPLQLAPYKCSNLLTYRRLRWLADVLHTDDIRLSRQVVYWESNSTKWKPEKPRKYWTDTIHQDLKEFAWLGHNSIGVWPSVSLTWDELSSRALVALKKFSAGSQLGYCNF